MIKIAFFDTKPYDKIFFDKYSEKYNIYFKYFENKLSSDTAMLASGCDGVVAFVNDIIDKETIDRLCDCSINVIAMRCSGYNNIDFKHAHGKIKVLHVPAYSPHAIAEYAFAMLLTFNRKTHKAYIRVRDYNFSLNRLMGFDLYGKTAGIIGTGRIGKCFAEICRGFGMKVIAYDPYPDEKAGIDYVSLDELCVKSDIISLHCPLSSSTKHIINRNTLDKMKENVVIINTSRGALIDSEALLEKLKTKSIAGACLDVYEEESELFFEDFSGEVINDDTLSLLLTMPNVLITSHQAFFTEEALENIAMTTLENLDDYFMGQPLKNEIKYGEK